MSEVCKEVQDEIERLKRDKKEHSSIAECDFRRFLEFGIVMVEKGAELQQRADEEESCDRVENAYHEGKKDQLEADLMKVKNWMLSQKSENDQYVIGWNDCVETIRKALRGEK